MGLKLFGKNIYQVYTHHIMRIDYETILGKTGTSKTDLVLRPIKKDNIKKELEPIGTTVTVANLERLIRNNSSLIEGFICCNANGDSVGTIWIMYKGGNDLEYRIRDIDAYIFDVYINERFRGNGYAGGMIRLVMDHLQERAINTAYLAVSLSNKSAINAYKKTGFVTVFDKKFTRVLKMNIPYPRL